MLSTPPDVRNIARSSVSELIPDKSKERYDTTYRKFMSWKEVRKVQSFSETVILAYLKEMSEKVSCSTLWSVFSMLKLMVRVHHDIDFEHYSKVKAFLKCKSRGYRPKKSRVLTREDVLWFLNDAGADFLFEKVVLVIGICGACRAGEIVQLSPEDVLDCSNAVLITLRGTKTKKDRNFTVTGRFYDVVKQYSILRLQVSGAPKRFFLNFKNGKCTRQPVGIHKISSIPKKIAVFLGLPDADKYTGHCFRRSSGTLIVDAGGDIVQLKRHGGWKSSSVAEGYIEDNAQYKFNVGRTIEEAVFGNMNLINRSFSSRNEGAGTSGCGSNSTSIAREVPQDENTEVVNDCEAFDGDRVFDRHTTNVPSGSLMTSSEIALGCADQNVEGITPVPCDFGVTNSTNSVTKIELAEQNNNMMRSFTFNNCQFINTSFPCK